jgi:hypothetical protein
LRLQLSGAIDEGIAQFCDAARARLERCLDFEGERAFLVDYVTGIVYTRYKVSIRGLVPIMAKTGQDHSSEAVTLVFRIEGEIKCTMLHGDELGAIRLSNRGGELAHGSEAIGRGHSIDKGLRPLSGFRVAHRWTDKLLDL